MSFIEGIESNFSNDTSGLNSFDKLIIELSNFSKLLSSFLNIYG